MPRGYDLLMVNSEPGYSKTQTVKLLDSIGEDLSAPGAI